MADMNERLDQWLRDAHAMEKQAEQMLEAQARRIENYPELKARIEQHVTETERQSERVRECLQRLGSDSSTLKDAGTKLMGLGQGLSGIFTSDEVMKGILASYTFEHMEIASYKILVATARRLGDMETARVCEEILQEEVAMARWLEERLEGLTEKFLDLEMDETATAKH